MKFVDEFRTASYAKSLADRLQSLTDRKLNLMEVCGTHTMAIFRYGIRDVLPANVRLISGPGCPVCVTPQSYIDTALELSQRQDVIITTFGDLMRVPGKKGSLLKYKAQGADIRIVYSPMDAMTIAQENPSKKVVFLSVGFETTIPMTAITAIEAKNNKIKNLFFFTAHKVVPPALEVLVQDEELKIDGFLLPGHVSAIIGIKPYEFLGRQMQIPGAVTGFEPTDILQGLTMLINMVCNEDYRIDNQYTRIVRQEGNAEAIKHIEEVFETADTRWRGIGCIPNSGYVFNKDYAEFDAIKYFEIDYVEYDGSPGCKCGEILKGKITPVECPLFQTVCTPDNPVGSCMVSSEGTCAAYYRYHRGV